jgi:tetratricopeptide (TPR) repeat protein
MARKWISFFYQLPTVLKHFLLGLSLVLLAIVWQGEVKAQMPNGAILTQTGHEQLRLGNPSTAIKTWSAAYKAYSQINDSEGMTGSLINQSLGFQAQGFYNSACNTLLIALKLQDWICPSSAQAPIDESPDKLAHTLQNQPLKKVQIVGLHQLGNVLRLMGNPQASFVVLQKAIAMTSDLKLTQSKLYNQLLLSLADTERTLYLQAKNKYQLTDDPGGKQKALITAHFQAKSALSLYQKLGNKTQNIVLISAQLNQLKLLLELEEWSDLTDVNFQNQRQLIQPLIKQLLNIDNQFDDLPAIDSIYARLNLAESLIQVAQNAKLDEVSFSKVDSPLLTALSISNKAWENAEKLNNTRAKSYALGTIGKIHACLGQILESQKYLEPAMGLAQSVKAWDIAYQWQWRLGSLYRQLKQTQKADEAYAAAISSLDQIRGNILAMNPDIQFNFKEKVEPVYHESEMLNPNTKLYISSYTNSKKPKIVNMTSSPQTNEHN